MPETRVGHFDEGCSQHDESIATSAFTAMDSCDASVLTPSRKSSIAVLSPRIDFYISPSSNSAVGFFLGITAFDVLVEGSNRGVGGRVILCRVDATPISCGTSLSSNSPRVNDFRQALGYNGPD
jgi:hypothetical protein